MEFNAVQRMILVQNILAEAEVFRCLKLDFPYYTEVNFEYTNNIFSRHGCVRIWEGADWDRTSTNTLCDLYMDIRMNVQFVRSVEILCAMAET